ncbi:MAG TPA: thiol peroxidase [bacterium]|nr:thiol peroxidase [bacterium]
MNERKGLVTMGGNPVTLVGGEVKVGSKAPDFTAIDNSLKPMKLSDVKDKVVVLLAVPSLDTPVCSLETARFNREAEKLGPDIKILTVSMDLPFAQKRWCGAEGVTRVRTVSDHRDAEFGLKYGVLMKETRLLARAVFVVDKKGVVRYAELVPEIGKEPNYDAALKAARKLI